MTTFRTLTLPTLLDTSRNDLSAEFFEPLLSRSIRYDRGVGFFSSGWLRVNAKGLVAFAEHGGRARWVTSPILDEADWEALQMGEIARQDPHLHQALLHAITDIATNLREDTRSALAWMVADEILTFKLALPRNQLERGDFHDKFGIFTDTEGNQVSFNGSYNDSIQGLRNYESIKAFPSWEPAFAPLVQHDATRFEHLWNNLDPNVLTFALPDAARAKILELRVSERPYPKPPWVSEHVRESFGLYSPPRPRVPETLTLYDYQVKAIDSWFEHDGRGLLEMATGTGKTITALAASARLYEREQRLAVVISVPYQHLVDQWADEAGRFGYHPILAYQNKAHWLDELNEQVLAFNGGHRRFISVITTHTTFSSDGFQATLARLHLPILFIGDEAHHLGATRARLRYPQHVPYRLALSATPDRWFDDAGTQALRDYFGETVFAFPLERAIGYSLTPYYYHPHLVPLTDAEMVQYEEFSVKIARLVHSDDAEAQAALNFLLIKRAKLLNKAENKLDVLSTLVEQQPLIQHTLFYCAPGQINEVLRLLGWEKGLTVHTFTAKESNAERQRLLYEFAQGELQGLVAMKCLDEGVDVPSTRTAYFLASSSNPREFIQRRGRILRKALGKEFSVIHDLIAVPPSVWHVRQDSPAFQAERSIMRRELARFREFADPALNKHQALDVVWEIAQRYNLRDF